VCVCVCVCAGRVVAESRMEIAKCRGLCYLAACMADELVSVSVGVSVRVSVRVSV